MPLLVGINSEQTLSIIKHFSKIEQIDFFFVTHACRG